MTVGRGRPYCRGGKSGDLLGDGGRRSDWHCGPGTRSSGPWLVLSRWAAGSGSRSRQRGKHMTQAVDQVDSAAALRAAMVDELRGLGAFASESVEAAVGTVPRHLFAPGETLE